MSLGKTMWSGQTTVSKPRSSPRRTKALMDSGAEMGPLPGIVNPYFISVPLCRRDFLRHAGFEAVY